MEIRVSIAGQVVVDGQVDALNVNTAAEDIGGNADSLVEFLEFLVAFDAIDKISVMNGLKSSVALTALLG